MNQFYFMSYNNKSIHTNEVRVGFQAVIRTCQFYRIYAMHLLIIIRSLEKVDAVIH